MASTNPNITPSTGLVEGDRFQLLLRPKDVDSVDTNLSAIVIKIQNGTNTTEIALVDLASVVIDTVTYYEYSWLVGPGKTQIQAVSTGNVDAAELGYIKATKLPIA